MVLLRLRWERPCVWSGQLVGEVSKGARGSLGEVVWSRGAVGMTPKPRF